MVSSVQNLALNTEKVASVTQRIVSVDIMRGITVALMILVNSPGSWSYVYPILAHAPWHGCTLADLVFPFFLFLVGLSISMSLAKAKMHVDKSLYGKIFIRAVKLFLLGLLLNYLSTFDFVNLRIPGVLQRISIVFLVCSIIFLNLNFTIQVALFLFIITIYSLCMTLIPIDGKVSLIAGENLASWIDSKLLLGHMWSVTRTWDPEGVFSTLPAIASGTSGMILGHLIALFRKDKFKFNHIIILGFSCVVTGLAWHYLFPINKSLWSSSYVLLTSGLATLVLSGLMYVIDNKNYIKSVTPFQVFGSNAIVAYVLSELLTILVYNFNFNNLSIKEFCFDYFVKLGAQPFVLSLIMAICWVGICYLPLMLLYKRKIFIKI